MIYNAYHSKKIIVIYAFDSAYEKFDVCVEVALWWKFPCGPLEINSWVEPKLDMSDLIDSNVVLVMYLIEGIRFGT